MIRIPWINKVQFSSVQSVLTTSVKILPYRPPARLIRANYDYHLEYKQQFLTAAEPRKDLMAAILNEAADFRGKQLTEKLS